jgi:hypothetical protein
MNEFSVEGFDAMAKATIELITELAPRCGVWRMTLLTVNAVWIGPERRPCQISEWI